MKKPTEDDIIDTVIKDEEDVTRGDKMAAAKEATVKAARATREAAAAGAAATTSFAKEAAKKTETVAKKAAKKTANVTKEATKKSVNATKKAAKKTAEFTEDTAEKVKESAETTKQKITKPKRQVYVQCAGRECSEDELVDRAIAQFSAMEGAVPVKKIALYLKPEEMAAYYVINEQYTGRVEF